MFCRKTKNRVCTSHNPQMVLFKTNTTITEPKPACRRPLRSRFHNGVKTQLANFNMTSDIISAYNTTLDKLFSDDGFGQPNSSNRKQKTFNTDNLAVPIPMVEPTDIFGIVDTNISVTIPTEVNAGVSAINLVFSDDTPITCCPDNLDIKVEIPEIITVSLSKSV